MPEQTNTTNTSDVRGGLRLIVNANFKEHSDFAAFARDNAAVKFAQRLLAEHLKKKRKPGQCMFIESMPEDEISNRAVEILFNMGYSSNYSAGSVDPACTHGFVWVTERGMFENG